MELDRRQDMADQTACYKDSDIMETGQATTWLIKQHVTRTVALWKLDKRQDMADQTTCSKDSNAAVFTRSGKCWSRTQLCNLRSRIRKHLSLCSHRLTQIVPVVEAALFTARKWRRSIYLYRLEPIITSECKLSWMFEYDCLDTCCFGCLICMCFVFLYLHLFGAAEQVSHGKVL